VERYLFSKQIHTIIRIRTVRTKCTKRDAGTVHASTLLYTYASDLVLVFDKAVCGTVAASGITGKVSDGQAEVLLHESTGLKPTLCVECELEWLEKYWCAT
jgi:hypothetical protein